MERKKYIHDPTVPPTEYARKKWKNMIEEGKMVVDHRLEEMEISTDDESGEDIDHDSDKESDVFKDDEIPSKRSNDCSTALNESCSENSNNSDNPSIRVDISEDTGTVDNTLECFSDASQDGYCNSDSDDSGDSDYKGRVQNSRRDSSESDTDGFDRPYGVNDAQKDGLYSSDDEVDHGAELRRFGFIDAASRRKAAEEKLFQLIQINNIISPATILRLYLGSNRYPYEANASMKRDEAKHVVCARKALITGLPCLGVRYLSPLINLNSFRIVDGFCPEYMHQYDGGSAKTITKCI
ncbi:hypothetical protein QAD02_020529 [Eretmocerus hayati]|uniref:Uncharacterized protein n=1 Tax=Eretmocerus hayati TaxID=131215 RepID=A0ACC2PNY3_9HYME|nr:hypothetical protein QAD02_020529 [Eretmocerus hayati]